MLKVLALLTLTNCYKDALSGKFSNCINPSHHALLKLAISIDVVVNRRCRRSETN